MNFRFIVPVLASLAFAAPAALAQDGPQPDQMHQRMSEADMAKHRSNMCGNHYAQAVGRMAALEVKLKLTSLQKPLFERWKNVRLASAKDHSEKCATMKMPNRDMSIMDGVKLETAMLEMRLADLKAETPALDALVNSLDADQQQTMKRAALHAMHDRMGRMDRFMDHRHDMRMMHRMRDGNPTPSAN